MRCGAVELEKITDFLGNFPQLKKLGLKVNRVDIDINKIMAFLDRTIQLNALDSLDVVCRDFRELTLAEKKDLEVCKFRLSQEKIQFHIVFEELMANHLPDYVDLISEDEEEEQEEEGQEEQEEQVEESEEDEDYDVEEDEEIVE